MKFIKAWKKGKKYLIYIDLEDGSKKPKKWMETTQAVYNYAKNQFEEGDEIGITYAKENGQYNVSRVNKDGTVKTETTTDEDEGPEEDDDVKRCEDCGKELKDPKYDKCYTCNQKNPSKKSTEKSSERTDSIKMQTAYKVAGMSIQVFTGQIADLDVLKEQLDDIAEHVYKKF